MDTQLNIIGRISHFFSSNRPLSFLLVGTLVIFGSATFLLLPKQYNPEIQRPAFVITTAYDDVTSEEAIDRVMYRLVEKIRAVPGVDDILSEVHDGTRIKTTVIFDVGYDTTQAKVDLISQIEQHAYFARGVIPEPHIQEINPETIPVLQLVFSDPTQDLRDLRQSIIALSHAVLTVRGVSGVDVRGGYESAVDVYVDPVRLASRGVGVEAVTMALQGSSVRMVNTGFVGERYVIETVYDDRIATLQEYETIEVAPGVLLADVATVSSGVVDRHHRVLYADGDARGDVVMLAVAKLEGTSAPIVTGEVRMHIDTWIAEHAPSLKYAVVADDGAKAQREIFGLTFNLITSVLIVVSILFLFLSPRAATVVLVAIPLTLLIVFGVGYLAGETINRITLFALILSLGLLVDAAIVVTENIYRHLSMAAPKTHQERVRTIARAVNEVGVGLFLSLVTSVIVFLPMAYITGMMGPYMGPIAFFVPAALVVSFFVAIVVTPFVSSLVLTKVGDTAHGIRQWFGAGLDVVTSYYARTLRAVLNKKVLQRRIVFGLAGLFVLSFALPMFGLVHFQMLPRADQDQWYVYLDLPNGTAPQATTETVERITDLFVSDPMVVSVQWFVAEAPIIDFNGLFKGAQNRTEFEQATARVNLVPASERAMSSSDIANAMRDRVAQEMPEVFSYTRFVEEPPGPPVQATLVAKILTDDAEMRTKTAQAFAGLLSRHEQVVDIHTTERMMADRIVYELSRDKARVLDVDTRSVAYTMAVLTEGVTVAEFTATSVREPIPVRVGVAPRQQDQPSDIDAWSVVDRMGSPVPLSALLLTRHEQRQVHAHFEHATPVSYVTAEVIDRPILYAIWSIVRSIYASEWEGYQAVSWSLFHVAVQDEGGNVARIAWGGEWEMTLENFRDLGLAMLVALLLVYAVLVAQYNSFAKPAYILVTVPLGLIGILWGFLFLDQGFGIYLTATALIGFIALIGIVVNNAIIYLEYVEQEELRGTDRREALVAAGTARLRPILLTSLTTVFGSLTIASDPVWSGLAWAIVFGLSLSTLLTLFVYPTLLAYFTIRDESEIDQ
jgi:multidrug efflux pump subunit AcrB